MILFGFKLFSNYCRILWMDFGVVTDENIPISEENIFSSFFNRNFGRRMFVQKTIVVLANSFENLIRVFLISFLFDILNIILKFELIFQYFFGIFQKMIFDNKLSLNLNDFVLMIENIIMELILLLFRLLCYC